MIDLKHNREQARRILRYLIEKKQLPDERSLLRISLYLSLDSEYVEQIIRTLSRNGVITRIINSDLPESYFEDEMFDKYEILAIYEITLKGRWQLFIGVWSEKKIKVRLSKEDRCELRKEKRRERTETINYYKMIGGLVVFVVSGVVVILNFVLEIDVYQRLKSFLHSLIN